MDVIVMEWLEVVTTAAAVGVELAAVRTGAQVVRRSIDAALAAAAAAAADHLRKQGDLADSVLRRVAV